MISLASLLISVTIAAAGYSQEDASANVEERLRAFINKRMELDRQFRAELSAAKGERGKVIKANEDHMAARKELADRVKLLIREEGSRPEAFDAVRVLVERVGFPLDRELTRLVIDHHLSDPEIGQFCFYLRYRGGENWVREILTAVAEKHPDSNVRGLAVYALGDTYRNDALPIGRKVTDEDKSRLLDQAAHYYRRAIEEYAETRTPDAKTTLGKKAQHELKRITNLPNLELGGTAPPIVGEDLEGKPLRLEDYRGKVVLLVFWGSWCGPCMAMVPHERELYERHRDEPFVLLGVNCGDSRDKALATAKEKQMDWRHWWDGEEIRGPIQTEYNVPHWPRIFLIDASGVIRAIDVQGEELDEEIEKLLAEV